MANSVPEPMLGRTGTRRDVVTASGEAASFLQIRALARPLEQNARRLRRSERAARRALELAFIALARAAAGGSLEGCSSRRSVVCGVCGASTRYEYASGQPVIVERR